MSSETKTVVIILDELLAPSDSPRGIIEIKDPAKTSVDGIPLSELLEEHGRASRRTGVLR